MPPAHVFGYGSLLAGPAGTPCRLAGHRRVWGVAMDNRRTIPGYKYFVDAATGERPAVFVAFLDVVPAAGEHVDGVALRLRDGELEALDARERNYRRAEVGLDGLGAAWAYTGRDAARKRCARAVAAGVAVVSRAYLEGVRAGLAAHGLTCDVPPDLPVVDLVRVDVPVRDRG